MELRKDYLLNRWTIVASKRSIRPHQFSSEGTNDEKTDYFAPGNEHLTPEEIGRVPDGDSWKIRWFPNKFPFIVAEGNPTIETHNEFYTFAQPFGYHEVIAETPTDQQLWDLPVEHIIELLKVYNRRIIELSEKEHVQYVLIFKNHGAEAGTSLIHSHTQVTTLSVIPQPVQEECQAYKTEDQYDRIIQQEKASERRCFENDRFVAFTPYASRFNYEILILPKRHLTTMQDFDEYDYRALAYIMTQILTKLKELNAPYNYYLHYAPEGEHLRFHIEVLPRVTKWAGFELGSGITVISVSPEQAAAFYRGEND